MNKMFKLCLVVGLVILIAACSEGPVTKVAPEGQMIALVDGKAWKSTQSSAAIGNGLIRISAKDENGSEIEIKMRGTAAGSYSVQEQAYVSMSPSNGTNDFTSAIPNAATRIVITKIDEQNALISGTFHSKIGRNYPVKEEFDVKDGSFTKIPYTIAPENFFSVEISGLTFTPTEVTGAKASQHIVLQISSGVENYLAITLPVTTTIGSHDLGMPASSEFYADYADLSSSSVYQSVSGSIDIVAHDTINRRIEGTFNCYLDLVPFGGELISMTEGSFAISY